MHGVPHEYAWATSDERIRAAGGMGIQRMAMDTWLELIEEEKELGTGHLLPCGNSAEAEGERRLRLRGVFAEPGDFGGAWSVRFPIDGKCGFVSQASSRSASERSVRRSSFTRRSGSM